jgi:hypothetical protein
MTDQTEGVTMKVTKCGTCGLGVRESDDTVKVQRMTFHVSYEGCMEAQNRQDAQYARGHRAGVVTRALVEVREDAGFWVY